MTTPTISQKTASAIANLYGSYFGQPYNSKLLRSKVQNRQLADFLFKLNFHDDTRRKALSRVSPTEINEFILSFFTGKAIDEDVRATLESEDLKHLTQGLSRMLAEGILNEVQPVLSNADESFRDKVRALLYLLREEGYFFYKDKLLTNEELVAEFGVWFNKETGKFINMRDANKAANVPTAEGFMLAEPLYNPYELDTDSSKRLLYQLGSEVMVVDSFCVDCGLSSTFRRTGPDARHAHSGFDVDFEVALACTRNESHVMKFYFRVRGNSITKVGQYPSLADLVQGDVRKYRKVLRERYTEFTKAIGLAAHGVGVGSFVYLRRIFEDLITKAYESANKDAEWQRNNAAGFLEKRMNDKILLLKDFLPDFLVQNREMYGILSKGVHDLTEQECLEYFPVVQKGIELILDDEMERLERKAKTADTQKAIDAIRNKIGNK